MATKKGLGRGLNTLLDTQDRTEQKPVIKEIIKEVEQTLKIDEMEPNRNQPRKNFNEDALMELAESIKQHGLIEPINVTKRGDYYLIVAGERRWRAARLAGLKKIPVVIREYSDREIAEIGLIENIQREDLNPIEEAAAYQKLIQEFGLKQDEVADRVSKSRVTITNALRLLKLTKKVQQMLIDDMLSTGHVRALIPIEDAKLQYETACKIFDEKLSVRETEKLVRKILSTLNASEKVAVTDEPEDLSFLYNEIEEKLKYKLGSKIAIKAKSKDTGKIEITYFSEEELERITELIYSITTNQ